MAHAQLAARQEEVILKNATLWTNEKDGILTSKVIFGLKQEK
jgi:hypothetical protein